VSYTQKSIFQNELSAIRSIVGEFRKFFNIVNNDYLLRWEIGMKSFFCTTVTFLAAAFYTTVI